MDIKDLEVILSLLKKNDVDDFELNQDGVHLKLSRGKAYAMDLQGAMAVSPVHRALPTALDTALSAAGVGSASNVSDSTLTKVESPIVGTFYRKSSPGAQSFIAEGGDVKKGQTLCIVEAMKLMNEIEAPCDGKVEKIVAQDGKVVEYGEVLFLIKPL